jgi:hypothetical protein
MRSQSTALTDAKTNCSEMITALQDADADVDLIDTAEQLFTRICATHCSQSDDSADYRSTEDVQK